MTYCYIAMGHFIDDVYTFADKHQEYGLYCYNDILFENGIEWDNVSMREVDTSGTLLHFFETGTITKWLNRLKEIDKKRVLTETNSQGS